MTQLDHNHVEPVPVEQAPMAADRTAGWEFFREAGEVFQDIRGVWYFTSLELVQWAFRTPEIFSSRHAFDVSGAPVQEIPVAVDPPDHVRYRRVLDPMFSPRALTPIEPELRLQAAELIGAFADGEGCDVIADLARLFPTQVFLTLFGMPPEDRDKLMDWVHTIQTETVLTQGEPSAKLAKASEEMTAYLLGFIEEKRKHPTDDVFSNILALEGENAWSDEEILGFAYLFMLAGLDTVTATIGFVMHYLATHPDVRRRVVADPDAINPIVEEIIRLETVAPQIPRITTEDIEIGGFQIPAGSMVVLVLGAANRAPAKYPNPNEVDLEQAELGHLTFGGGIHRCVGSHLARRELRLVVDEFHKRIPAYRLADGVRPTVAWPSTTIRFASLPLVFERSSS